MEEADVLVHTALFAQLLWASSHTSAHSLETFMLS